MGWYSFSLPLDCHLCLLGRWWGKLPASSSPDEQASHSLAPGELEMGNWQGFLCLRLWGYRRHIWEAPRVPSFTAHFKGECGGHPGNGRGQRVIFSDQSLFAMYYYAYPAPIYSHVYFKIIGVCVCSVLCILYIWTFHWLAVTVSTDQQGSCGSHNGNTRVYHSITTYQATRPIHAVSSLAYEANAGQPVKAFIILASKHLKSSSSTWAISVTLNSILRSHTLLGESCGLPFS